MTQEEAPQDKRVLLLTVSGIVNEIEMEKYKLVFSTVFTDYEFSLSTNKNEKYWKYEIKIYNLNMLSIVEKIMFSLKFNMIMSTI